MHGRHLGYESGTVHEPTSTPYQTEARTLDDADPSPREEARAPYRGCDRAYRDGSLLDPRGSTRSREESDMGTARVGARPRQNSAMAPRGASAQLRAQPVSIPFLDAQTLLGSLGALVTAFLLAIPIAWNRERGRRRMGLRTLPLVAVASCAYVLIGMRMATDNPDSLARIVQGLMTGVGFIGGGAILKSKEEVKGASTAAAIWATGAMGAAVAMNRLELALAIALLTFLTFLVLTPVREKINGED